MLAHSVPVDFAPRPASSHILNQQTDDTSGLIASVEPITLRFSGGHVHVECVCGWRESVEDAQLAESAASGHARRHDAGTGFFDGRYGWIDAAGRTQRGVQRRDMGAYNRLAGGVS